MMREEDRIALVVEVLRGLVAILERAASAAASPNPVPPSNGKWTDAEKRDVSSRSRAAERQAKYRANKREASRVTSRVTSPVTPVTSRVTPAGLARARPVLDFCDLGSRSSSLSSGLKYNQDPERLASQIETSRGIGNTRASASVTQETRGDAPVTPVTSRVTPVTPKAARRGPVQEVPAPTPATDLILRRPKRARGAS